MMNVTINTEKNGVEIRFDSKPEQSVLDVLRNNGFRWSGKQKMWYAKQSEEVFAAIKGINSSFVVENKPAKPARYDLWEMTRTDGIGDNYAKTKLTNGKEIAAIVRKHIKPRFPMCKFSVKSDYNSIDIELLASPFAKDSEEVKAIIHYVYTFANSYNYDNSDLMTDYFDVNFYIGSEHNIVSYHYEQTEMTVEYANMSAMFNESKVEFETAEKMRKQKEHEAYLAKRAEEERAYQEHEKQRKINHEAIESGVEVVNLENGYFLNELLSPHCNKMNTIAGGSKSKSEREVIKLWFVKSQEKFI